MAYVNVEDNYGRTIRVPVFNESEDGSGTWHVPVCDTSGYLKVNMQSVLDNILWTLGTDSDIAMVLRSATLNADTNLTGVLVGVSQDTSALAANSLIISNITTDGDILIAVSDGGHSKQMLFLDGSTGITHIGKPGTPGTVATTGDVYMAGNVEVASGLFPAGGLNLKPDVNLVFGFGASSMFATFQSNDSDARCLTFVLDDGGAFFVPVMQIGDQSINNADLGFFDGVTEPLYAAVDSDIDSWVGIGHTADDSPAIRIGGSNTGVAIQGTDGVIQRIAYAQILEILGDCSGFWPFIEATGAASVPTDISPNGQVGTPSKDIGTWDTPPAFQGSVQVYDFDGVDEEFDVADNALFTTATAFSVGAWVNMTVGTDSTIIAAWDVDNTQREFRLFLDASGYPSFECYDESGDDTVGRRDETAIGTGSYKFVVGVFDGGTDAANAKVYIQGIQTDDADTADDASFADIEDTGAALMIGHIISTGVAELHDGAMWGPFYTKKELSADEVWNLYQIGRGLLNV